MPNVANYIVLLLLCLNVDPLSASSMISSMPKKMSVEYPDGDRIEVLCSSDHKCSLRIKTEKKTYQYDSAELGAEPSPEWARLFAYPRNNSKYFTFQVSVYCPDELDGRDKDCFASGAVQDGTLVGIEIITRTILDE